MKVIPSKITNILAKVSNIKQSDERYEILLWGVDIICTTIFNTIIALIISLILGIWKEFLLFFMAFSILRIFGCGVHLGKGWQCALFGTLTFVGGAYLSKISVISWWVCLIIFVGVFIICYLYAPAGTKYRPIGKSRKNKNKFILLLCLGVSYSIAITTGLGMIRNIVVFSSIAQSISVMPITYLILGEGRVKDYEK